MKKQFLQGGFLALTFMLLSGLCVSTYAQYNETFKAQASDASSSNSFGTRVAISGNYAMVSAPNNYLPGSGTHDGNALGAVYFYEKGPGTTWNEVSMFRPAYLYGPETNLGVSLAMDGTLAVAGAYYLNNLQDAVYVYQRTGSTWNHLIRLHESTKGFGNDVDVSGNNVIVGAAVGGEGDDYGKGRAYIYEYNGDPGYSGWNTKTILASSDAPNPYFFGEAVAISGNYAAVTASGDIDAIVPPAVYVFERTAPGVWGEVQKLESASGAFGIQLAMEGNTLVVSSSFALSGGVASGVVYVYERDGSGTWNLSSTIMPPEPAYNDAFGSNIDIENNRIIIGSQNDDDDGENSGSAYIYQRSGTSWTMVGKWTASDAAAGDNFGHDVGITGTYAVVGAPGDSDSGLFSGSAYFIQHQLTIPPVLPRLIIRVFPNPNFGRFILAAAEVIGEEMNGKQNAEQSRSGDKDVAEELLKVDEKSMKLSSTGKIIKGKGLLTIANEKGTVIIQEKITMPLIKAFNLTKYGPGVYFITIETKDNKETVRVLVRG